MSVFFSSSNFERISTFGCGRNKAKYAGNQQFCIENGLDFYTYRQGKNRIKKIIKREYDIDLDIEGKNLNEVSREAMEIY